jgi:1-acyl-sn-glycerol-3-phosphate acyltransferase
MHRILLILIYRIIIRGFLKIFVGVKFDSARFLLAEGQFIIVANHNSHLDTMAIMASLPSKIIHKVKPVAAADHFGKSNFQSALSRYFVNALLIKRKRDKENPLTDPINLMVKALDDGFSLIIFPEGTRGQPEIQQPIKPGIGYVLSQRPTIKYVPAHLKGMGKAMPKDDSLIVPFTSSLVYGKPAIIKNTTIREIMDQVEADIYALK